MGATRRLTTKNSPANGNCGPLEKELSRALDRLTNERNRMLVAAHLGWSGRPPCSLSQAGAGFGVTRERARQIYAEALPILRQSAEMPRLDAVLDFIQQREHELVSDVESELQRQEFTNGRLSLRGVLRAAHVFGRKPGFQMHRVGSVSFVGADSQIADRILETATKAVCHHGAARVSEVCRQVAKGRRRAVDEQLTRRVLQTRPDLDWLDDIGEWFWLAAVPRNRLLLRVQKVLAIHPRIGFSILHKAISRDYNPVELPEPILRAVCTHFPWCRVGGEHVEARVALRVEEVLSEDEAVMCEVLRKHGGTMRIAHLQGLSLAGGIRKPNFWRILRYSPLVRRFDKGLYGLVGAEMQ